MIENSKSRIPVRHVAALACAGVALGACATTTADDAGPTVAEVLAAKGYQQTDETRSCLNVTSIRGLDLVSDGVFIARAGAGKAYVNVVDNGCRKGSPSDFIQYATSLSQLCRLQIVNIQDGSGFARSSCGLNDWRLLEKAAEADAAEQE